VCPGFHQIRLHVFHKMGELMREGVFWRQVFACGAATFREHLRVYCLGVFSLGFGIIIIRNFMAAFVELLARSHSGTGFATADAHTGGRYTTSTSFVAIEARPPEDTIRGPWAFSSGTSPGARTATRPGARAVLPHNV
jgi:hypothetical protein